MQILEMIVAVLAGFVFFGFRCRLRFWYGLAEVMAALIVLYFQFFPVDRHILSAGGAPQPTALEELLSMLVGLLAGMYILVRGLDNIDHSLPERWRSAWQRVFYGRAAKITTTNNPAEPAGA
jgi:hypothetical protein